MGVLPRILSSSLLLATVMEMRSLIWVGVGVDTLLWTTLEWTVRKCRRMPKLKEKEGTSALVVTRLNTIPDAL